MSPQPLCPDRPMHGTDNHHRWWIWNGHEVNLNEADLEAYPLPVRAAVLAHRDADSPEHLDAAAYLEWVIDEHPPWGAGCTECGTRGLCPDLRRAEYVATEFLVQKSWELIRRSRANIAHFDQKRAAA